MKPRVLISAINTGQVTKQVAQVMVKLSHDERVDSLLVWPTVTPYVGSLHKCIRQVLRDGFDFWVTMDHDNPPINNPLDLVFLDLPVVGLPTPVWVSATEPGDRPWYLNAVDWLEDKQAFRPVQERPGRLPEDAGLVKCDAVGSGCMVIARRVLEAIKAPFHRTWDEDGIVEIGGDYSFGLRCREAGIPVYAHFDYPCEHHIRIPARESIMAFQREVS